MIYKRLESTVGCRVINRSVSALRGRLSLVLYVALMCSPSCGHEDPAAPPMQPTTTLHAAFLSPTKIELHWNYEVFDWPEGNGTVYATTIERKDSQSSKWSVVGTVMTSVIRSAFDSPRASGSMSFIDAYLNPGADFYYRVTVEDWDNGHRPRPSSTVHAVTPANTGPWQELIVDPSEADASYYGRGDVMHFVDSNVGVVGPLYGDFFRTENGGATWSRLKPGIFSVEDIDFGSGTEGITVQSGGSAHTQDGGLTWTVHESPGLGWRSVDYVADQAWAVADDGAIRKTADGGVTWTIYSSGNNEPLHAICFLDENIGWATGGFEEGIVLRTQNGGSTWELVRVPAANGPLMCVAFWDTERGLTVGGGRLFATTDGGSTWLDQNIDGASFGKHARQNNSISLYSSNVGIVVGDNGVIVRTDDGGSTWTRQQSGTSVQLYGVQLLDQNIGFVVGNRTMLRTSTGGK